MSGADADVAVAAVVLAGSVAAVSLSFAVGFLLGAAWGFATLAVQALAVAVDCYRYARRLLDDGGER